MQIYMQALNLLIPRIIAFVKPKLKSSMEAIRMTKGQRDICSGYAQLIRQGIIVTNPKSENAKNVAKPHFIAKASSLMTTRFSYSSIIILTKACRLVAQSSASLSESTYEYPFLAYIPTISLFSCQSMCSTSQYSLYSSCLAKDISALADTQSQNPMSNAPATMVAMQIAKICSVVIPEEVPVRMMMVVLMTPSTPPQMTDLMNSPTEL